MSLLEYILHSHYLNMPKQVGNLQVYNYGERDSGFTTRGEPQDFERLRDECLIAGVLFEDPEFDNVYEDCEWRRPHEIVDNPQFFVEGVSRFDINQGDLGDCWFIAAVANLTLNENLLFRVVPKDQTFDKNYAGIFHFRFWQCGKWIDVVVDDRLPTTCGRLTLMHSVENEFWSGLLEKAYAKLHGSYKKLKGGFTRDALQDFTGGIAEVFFAPECTEDLFKIMLKAYQRQSMLGCAITNTTIKEGRRRNGLVTRHAYSITKVHEIQTENYIVHRLIRIRNPWGDDIEWNGPWSDQSPEWKQIPAAVREELGIVFNNDGEFWMSYEDFMRNFTMIEFCHLTPDATEDEISTRKKWVQSSYLGEWVKGVSAGGGHHCKETFHYNPQYLITVTDPDEEDDDDTCTVVVALMQAHTRRKVVIPYINYFIFDVSNPDINTKPLGKEFFRNKKPLNQRMFEASREISQRHKLQPGTYCIVPANFRAHEDGKFVLRIFAEHKNDIRENDVTMEEIHDAPPFVPDVRNVFYEEFLKHAGEDQLVNAKELQTILNSHLGANIFEYHHCRSLLSIFDEDRSGLLDFKEFDKVCKMLIVWLEAWNACDTDKSGTLSEYELRKLLTRAYYLVNQKILHALVLRYGNEDGELTLGEFILCAVKLKKMYDIYLKRQEKSTASFTLEEFLLCTLCN